MSFVLKPNLVMDVRRDQAKHFIIVGAGGNGAYFIRDFARQVKLQNDRLIQAGLTPHSVTVIDADDIEAKNLIRQNFISNDVGRNKAQVMATRYGQAFGIPMNFVNEYIKDKDHLLRIANNQSGYPVFMGAVDNNKTRKIIYEAFNEYSGSYWIDAGNEEWGGQVVCGYNHPKDATEAIIASKPTSFRLPCLIDIYPEVYDAQDKRPDEESCAERAVSAPQNVFTNLTAANLMLGFAYNILSSDSRLGEGLKCHAVAFNTKNLMSFNTRMNHVDLLQAKFDVNAWKKQQQATQSAPAPAPTKAKASKEDSKPVFRMDADGGIERVSDPFEEVEAPF